jgi:glycosyltransferase involved in cell wall biosynthesis
MSAVVHLRSSIGLYGAEHMLLGLCGEQARRGQAPLLAGFEHGRDLLEAAKRRGLPTLALACRGPVDLGCVRRLRLHLEHAAMQGARVLHCHDYKSVVYGWLAAAGLGLRHVATMHGWLQDDARLRLYRALEMRFLRGFERVCAVSDAIAAQLAQAGLHERRVRRVDNGIDMERFRAQAPKPAPEGRLRIGCAARLSPEKGLDRLVLAVAECRGRGLDLELTIHGEGELRPALERLVQRSGLQEQVRLPGNSSALERWYPQLDAFVLPSLTEGMPLTVLEALSCGTPVIASAVGAVPDVLRDLPGCSVVPPGDGAALVAELLRLRPRSAPLAALRERVAKRYSVAHMADEYERVYDEALAA